ncbi:conserved hypothetical protein, partial [Ricinus communis]
MHSICGYPKKCLWNPLLKPNLKRNLERLQHAADDDGAAAIIRRGRDPQAYFLSIAPPGADDVGPGLA